MADLSLIGHVLKTFLQKYLNFQRKQVNDHILHSSKVRMRRFTTSTIVILSSDLKIVVCAGNVCSTKQTDLN